MMTACCRVEKFPDGCCRMKFCHGNLVQNLLNSYYNFTLDMVPFKLPHAQKTSKVKSIEKCIVEVIKMLNSKCYTETLHMNRQERDGHIQTLIKVE